MLIIRLKPMGRKRRKHFRVVVAEKHRSVSKKAHDILGWYNPYTKEHSFNQEKVTDYLSHGAQMSDTARSLFKKYDISVATSTSETEAKPKKAPATKPEAKTEKKTSAAPAKKTAKTTAKKTSVKK